ncbi:MAG: hypothetical protein ACLFRI_05230 [Candidatus Izemoplasmataceae bacterium]
MKKLFVALTVLLFTLTLSACALSSNQVSNFTRLFDSSEDVYAFSALSAVSAMSELDNSTVINTAYTKLNESGDDPIVLEDIEALEPYLKLIETFMVNDGVRVTTDSSTLEGYEEMMLISIVDINGETVSYELHYNIFNDDEQEEALDLEDEADLDDDSDEEDEEDLDDEEELEEEIENRLEGILVINEASYVFTAAQEIENDEESFEMIAYLTESDYITIEYEIESEDGESETEFLLEMYQDDNLIKSTEIEFEYEDDETEMNLEFTLGNRVARYEFEIKEENNEQVIEIEFEISDSEGLVEEGTIEIFVIFDPLTNSTQISYEIKTAGSEDSRIVERDYDDEDDDDDDDDDEDEETETSF